MNVYCIFREKITTLHYNTLNPIYLYGSAAANSALPDSTFAIQTCFSFIEYVAWQKCSVQLRTKSLIILHDTAKDHKM